MAGTLYQASGNRDGVILKTDLDKEEIVETVQQKRIKEEVPYGTRCDLYGYAHGPISREQQICDLAALGYTDKAIAREIYGQSSKAALERATRGVRRITVAQRYAPST